MTWTLDEAITIITLDAGQFGKFDFPIADFFKSVKLDRLEDVEKLALVNGIKQKLADKVASSKELQMTIPEKLDMILDTWKRLVEKRQWNKPAESRKGVTTKIDAALSKASPEELAMMVKLGLTTQEKADKELERRKAE